MDIILSKKAAKALEVLDSSTRGRIVAGIHGIPQGDIKPLQGYSDGRLRLRVGKFRIVFMYVSDTELYIIDVGSRGDIYK